MNRSPKIIIACIIFLSVAALIANGFIAQANKKAAFEKENQTVAGYADSTNSRLDNAVITLPDNTTLVGLKNGHGDYTAPDTKVNGTVDIEKSQLQTKFIPGVFGQSKPRLDAIVPMYVAGDSKGGSMYIVLFWDRGDSAIEESYMRLGGADVMVGEIKILPGAANDSRQEYQVDVVYRLEGRTEKSNQITSIPKESIVPVVAGHFDPNGLVSK